MMEGSGSVALTIGSGSGRPKNLWIRRIRIRNNDSLHVPYLENAGVDGPAVLAAHLVTLSIDGGGPLHLS
jgi:hypothetical protein